MKNPVLAAIVAAILVSLGMTALALTLFLPATEPRSEAARTAPAAEPAAEPAQLEARLARLEQTLDDMTLRLGVLESRPIEHVSEREPVVALEPQALTDGAPAGAPLAASPGADSANLAPFEQRVDAALQRIREQERAKREEEREQARAQRIEDRLAQLSTDLGLSGYQVEEMRAFLTEQENKRAAIWDSLSDGNGDPGGVREAMRALRKEGDERLSTILDPSQLEAYQQQQGGFGFGRGFGRSGRDGGGAEGGSRRGGRNGGRNGAGG